MKLLEALDLPQYKEGITDFPAVVVDQTNVRISDIIKRNLAGEQVMGNQNLSYDYTSENQSYDPEKVNPFNDIGFNLDDVILLAEKNGQQVTALQNRLGEIKRELDKSKQEEKPVESKEPAAPGPK